MSSEESAGLRMMDEGAKMMEEVRVNFTTTFSNITNIYSKIKVLRAANALKCSKKKCDNIRTKVKKINQDVFDKRKRPGTIALKLLFQFMFFSKTINGK